MSSEIGDIASTVKAMRPMVPAKDFETSRRFYLELGFEPQMLTERLIEMRLGAFSFNNNTTSSHNLLFFCFFFFLFWVGWLVGFFLLGFLACFGF